MLILTRRMGERLMIGDDVSVTVLGVEGNQVRLGVDAPADVEVHREEIYKKILKERELKKTNFVIGESCHGAKNSFEHEFLSGYTVKNTEKR